MGRNEHRKQYLQKLGHYISMTNSVVGQEGNMETSRKSDG
jgi:hypothetical protein